jgi:hypothetical protein
MPIANMSVFVFPNEAAECRLQTCQFSSFPMRPLDVDHKYISVCQGCVIRAFGTFNTIVYVWNTKSTYNTIASKSICSIRVKMRVKYDMVSWTDPLVPAERSICLTPQFPTQVVTRVGQNRIYTLYMYTLYLTVHLVNSLPKIPYIHRIYIHRIWPCIWCFPCKNTLYTLCTYGSGHPGYYYTVYTVLLSHCVQCVHMVTATLGIITLCYYYTVHCVHMVLATLVINSTPVPCTSDNTFVRLARTACIYTLYLTVHLVSFLQKTLYIYVRWFKALSLQHNQIVVQFAIHTHHTLSSTPAHHHGHHTHSPGPSALPQTQGF